MVKAILANRKTKTRRTQGLEGINENPDQWRQTGKGELWEIGGFPHFEFEDRKTGEIIHVKSKYGKPEDQLWVRETWVWEGDTGWEDLVPMGSFFYKADFEDGEGPTKWKPSIFMPRRATRITLDIYDIRIERLNDISYSDAKAEGVEYPHDFFKLWESINGTGSWRKNPWVWVVTFKRIDNGT